MKTILLLVIVAFVGYSIPAYLYAGSLSNLSFSLYVTAKNFKKIKHDILLDRQKALNNATLKLLKNPSKEILQMLDKEELSLFLKKAKNNKFFDIKQTKKYIKQYERYDYTFFEMYKLNVKHFKTISSKKYNQSMSYAKLLDSQTMSKQTSN
jgi:hypothetical protein